jgi:putative photosynthetic complex assembly protein
VPRISRPVLIIATLLVIMVAIGIDARIARHAGEPPSATPVQSAELLMADNPDGSITVTQAGSGKPVATVPPNTNGFLRVVLAGMVRERRLDGMGSPTIPFRITRWSDGRLTVDDDATGKLIELAAFGHTNEGAFAQLLADATATSKP